MAQNPYNNMGGPRGPMMGGQVGSGPMSSMGGLNSMTGGPAGSTVGPGPMSGGAGSLGGSPAGVGGPGGSGAGGPGVMGRMQMGMHGMTGYSGQSMGPGSAGGLGPGGTGGGIGGSSGGGMGTAGVMGPGAGSVMGSNTGMGGGMGTGMGGGMGTGMGGGGGMGTGMGGGGGMGTGMSGGMGTGMGGVGGMGTGMSGGMGGGGGMGSGVGMGGGMVPGVGMNPGTTGGMGSTNSMVPGGAGSLGPGTGGVGMRMMGSGMSMNTATGQYGAVGGMTRPGGMMASRMPGTGSAPGMLGMMTPAPSSAMPPTINSGINVDTAGSTDGVQGGEGGVQGQQQKEVNTSTICRIGQETVEEIVARTLEVFSILKSLQPPLGQYTAQTQQNDRGILDKQNRLQEVLKGIGMLFKRLRVCWDKCEESTASIEQTQLYNLIPVKDDTDPYRTELEKKRGDAYKSALEEHNELIQQIVLKNRHLKDIIDQMRNTIWEINTMLAMRTS